MNSNRHCRICRLAAIGLFACFMGYCPASAAEPWANKKLLVTNGLAVWLDASAEKAARKHLGLPPLADADPMGVLHDASGNHFDVVQENPTSRPRIRIDGKRAFVQFDGRSTALAWVGELRKFRDLTIFVAAAPHENLGDFTALLAMNAADENDYVSGMNLDQGAWPTEKFDVLNAEGAGFGGALNLKASRGDFSKLQRICFRTSPGTGDTALFVNGSPAGKRDRADQPIRMQRLTIGARFYAHGQPPQTCGFLLGEIAEVLIYDRRLSDDEIASVDRYLLEKFGDLPDMPAPPPVAGTKPLVRVADPPSVQMFLPGFVVKQLMVDLPNINNVLYRDDGALVTVGYDGNIHLLTDTDGDGVEDRAELFWENKGSLISPVGMALTRPDDPRGRGVYVASKSKCALIVDTDGDRRADQEITIAEGWPTTTHGVDAMGLAVDHKTGEVYFGVGCADYTNGYLVDADGKSHYDIQSERGTIMRVASDFKSRQIIATGIRFPVAIRFNRDGELFCTDQEGATWLPNGNPLDELLHIRQGKHYGFPPQHPKHLPGVTDEPSLFDYRPQHQSTCGLNFNQRVNGGPVFGPKNWKSDALVTGYSRGKLYRTKLVKTMGGYVAQNQLLATLNMLPADVCVSPQGAIVIAAHSGGPDWGSGPSGRGKLFKVFYQAESGPMPVLIWAQTSREVRVAFDRQLEPEMLKDLAARASIDGGEFVAAGDRFESLRPGYASVANQLRSGRFDVPILGMQVTADRRTLLITTAPHVKGVQYALTLPNFGRPKKATAGELPQYPDIDLQYDLSGVDAIWTSEDGSTTWSGWLPHVDLEVSHKLTKGSAIHEELWAMLKLPGKLTMRGQLNLRDLLHPALQPGSKLDHEVASEEIQLESQRSPIGKFVVKIGGSDSGTLNDGSGTKMQRTLTLDPAQPLIPIEIETNTDDRGVPWIFLVYARTNAKNPTPFPLHRLMRDWATIDMEIAPVIDNRDVPELAGGNWLRGRQVFFSETASCGKCHRTRGKGGVIGPDLSNLVHRDYASVMRDIREPSFAINPDYLTRIVALDDGRVLTGSVRSEGETLIIGDQQGNETRVAQSEVSEFQPSPLSIMPQDLPQKLEPDKLRDLLTFLLTEPPRMPDYGTGTPPPPRTKAEVDVVLAGSAKEASTRPLHATLVAGKKDHGPGEHDYPAWLTVWQRLLSLAPETHVTTANDWPTSEDLAKADVLVFYQQGKWTRERAKDIDTFLARGGGLIYIHYAVDGGADAAGFAERIGLAWNGQSKFRHGDLDLHFKLPAEHPIARNFDKLHLHDESYWNLVGDTSKINLLATGREEDREQPLFWTTEPGKGRVFVSIPGHYAWTFDDPLFRVVLLRAIAWTAREPVDRFNELVWPGARIVEK